MTTVIQQVGDILNFKADYIVQQCNCLTIRAHGLAQSIANVYPDADTYAKRRQMGSRNLAIAEDRSTPGTISIHGHVINMYAQWRPGSCKTAYFSVYPEYSAEPESALTREIWFQKCLDAIAEKFSGSISIAFPFQIGCGLGGGEWSRYEKMISAFAEANPRFKVYIVTLPTKKRKIEKV